MSNFIKTLNQILIKDISMAGGKGASLGEMIKIGIPAPAGFVVLASAFDRFLKETDINSEIEAMWDRINIKDTESVEENSEIIRDVVIKAKMPEDLSQEILKEFDKLKAEYVAVRSSATAEDSKLDSWAGELESYLNTTRENLLKNVLKCWASLYTPRAIFYRAERGYLPAIKSKKARTASKVSVAVVIQKMVQSDISGVCFTVHPVTKDKNQMVIEAVWGLGEMLVQGIVTPDTYVVNKKDLVITDINLNEQDKMITKIAKTNKIIKVPKPKQNQQKLKGEQIIELAKLCIKIEKHYKKPQDIEWAMANNKLYIVQSRPITTLS